jgi:hypothetical protein
MMPDRRAHRVGTHGWSRATGGRLSAREMRQLAPAALGACARSVVGRLAMVTHLDRGRRRTLDADLLTPPSTILTWIAEAHAAERLTSVMLNHSRRTYAFGAALGVIEGVEVDHELLYVAALLHDLGLPAGSGDGTDFTLAGAAAACRIAEDVGLAPSAAETLASAITLHHSPDVRLADGPVAYLLSAGAALDVTGLRCWDLPPSAVDRILEVHPRTDFKRFYASAFREESTRVPRGRARFLERYAAFDLAIRSAPFRE